MKRINLAISSRGYCSRREAEKLIKEKKVFVNGELVTNFSLKVKDTDKITINNETRNIQKHVYYLLNKPSEYLCANKDSYNRRLYWELINPKDRAPHLFYIGRLDYKSQGLLIVTNDGNLSQMISHPKHKIEKEYIVIVKQELSPIQLQKFAKGIQIPNKYNTNRCQIYFQKKVKHVYEYKIILKEGKKRQIREMMDYFNNEVISLTRTRIGKIKMDNLLVGNYKTISQAKIYDLLSLKLSIINHRK